MENWFNHYSGTIAVVSLIIAVLSLIVAYLAFRDQKKRKIILEAGKIVPSNLPYYCFEALENPELIITNLGSKPVSIVDIALCVGKDRFSIPHSYDNPINIYIESGKTEHYHYKRDWAIEVVTVHEFKKDYLICWETTTNEGKKAKCKTKNHVSDYYNVDVEKGNVNVKT